MSDSLFNNYLSLLPPYFIEQILRLKRWQDAQSSLIGKLLLRQILYNYKNEVALNDMKITNTGKPYIDNSFDFNITHSGCYVICSFSDEGRIGIDLEKVDQIEFKKFESIFTSKEFKYITLSEEPLKSFYKYWTIKEAAVKADGRGLKIPLKEVEVNRESVTVQNIDWFYKEIFFQSDYIFHMVTDKKVDQTVVILQPNFDFNKNS